MEQRTPQGIKKYGRTTRPAQFLSEIGRIVPKSEVCAFIDPAYRKGSSMCRRPSRLLERVVHIYFLEQWFNLSGPALRIFGLPI